MAPKVIVTISQMNTMATKESTDDLELGEITTDCKQGNDNDNGIESVPRNIIHDSIVQNMNGTSDDAETSSHSELCASSYNDDQSNSNDTTGSPGTNTGSGQSSSSEESLNIAKKENLAVMTWRLVMFGVLIITTIAAAVTVYTAVHRDEKHDFESAFIGDSQKIYESLAHSMDTKLEAVDSLAFTLVSNARENNEIWPYTNLHDFAAKAAKIRMMSDAIAIQQYQYVEDDQRSKWEAWAKVNEAWVQETIDIQREDTTLRIRSDFPDYDTNQSSFIRYDGPAPNNSGPYTPTWHTYPMIPLPNSSSYNFNAIMHPILGPGIKKVIQDQTVVIGPILNYEDEEDSRVNVWVRRHVSPDVNVREPIIRILYPILDTTKGAITIAQPDSKVVGIIASSFFIKNFLENILPIGEKGLVVVFQNTCNQTFTYEVNGHEADWLGFGDQHDTQFDHLTDTRDLEEIGFYTTSEGLYGGLPIDVEFCHYSVSTYPSMKMKNTHHTNFPIYYTFIAVSIFIFTAMFFICYDKLVSVRQQKVMKTAIQSTTIVSSLFPSNVRDRLLDVNGDGNNADHARGSIFQPTKSRLRTFLNDGERTNDSNRPIADLFTDTTVMFADIAGFTAWSSVREPTQVFTLLETVYGAFDIIANKRGVFKVETIGDSYVAVTGLPDPRKDHAVAMVKFARDCRGQFNELCSALENTLGPETGDLHLRIGLNSGPVTAGVLRGQKSRFQLFGDTVNTAARMESTGKVNKIQVSQTTADLLKKAKKSHWLQTRDEMVDAKGKGLMITYWVEPKSVASSTVSTADLTTENTKGNLCLQDDMPIGPRVSSQLERLVNWNIDVLERLLKKVVARRIALKRKVNRFNWNKTNSESMIVLDEVQEVIKLPEYDSKYSDFSPDSIVLEQRVRIQLREFVTTIALTYHNNPFHNFPHASHVGMSVAKLLSRIVAPDIDLKGHEQLHDHTYGITSDPLTQFACVFSALIHDADHPGVPNSQLVYEGTEMSETYKGKSIAEQNSINLAWSILLQDKYTELRKTICKSQAEATRFRQLVVNAVCATDIIDKDLKAARNKRWEKAFSVTGSSHFECKGQEQINRKATIVIEHIMQASDVAHTMQHWHIYIKWNERLYAEMYKAYMEGRSDKDPTSTWYKGEIGFFDFYVIPLAQKLSECGVFGVSSDEYLNYAIMNRLEWEKKGRDIVASYVEKYNRDKVLDKLDESLVAHVEQP